MTTFSLRRIARIAAVTVALAWLTIARPAAAESSAPGFQPLGGLTASPTAGMTQPFASRGASLDNVNVHPSLAWTANAYGRTQSSFRRGERILFSFSATSNRTRTARVTMTVRQQIWCVTSPCPDYFQVIYDRWVTFPSGSSSKYLAAVASASDPSGGWEYNVTIDESGRRGDGDDETVYTTFNLR